MHEVFLHTLEKRKDMTSISCAVELGCIQAITLLHNAKHIELYPAPPKTERKTKKSSSLFVDVDVDVDVDGLV